MPIQKQCKQCGRHFDIEDADLKLLEKFSFEIDNRIFKLPPPSRCYLCRLQRRLMWRNERSLYKTKCGLCKKEIISAYAPESGIESYCNKCWWSDKWDPLKYGRNYDENKPFFQQFGELFKSVPQIALLNDDGIASENCEYCQDNVYSKNCYLVSGCWHVEDAMFGHEVDYSKTMADCCLVTHSERCYECTNSTTLYDCLFVDACENSRDCLMSYDLIGCNNCVECCALRNKTNYLKNKPATADEIERRKKEILATRESIDQAREEFDKWSLQFPRKYANLSKCEDCVGNTLRNCKNTLGFSTFNAIDCRYFNNGDSPVSCMDVFQSGKPQLCYEGITPDESYQTHFTAFCWHCRNVIYSEGCVSVEDSIGCNGLKHGQYCILNKQYSKDEYKILATKIVEKLISEDSWGEFFPYEVAPFAYNEAMSRDFFPLKKDEALKLQASWHDEEETQYSGEFYEPHKSINEYVGDEARQKELLAGVLKCKVSGKPFKIMPRELAFYMEFGIPIPRKHPNVRYDERLKRRYFLNLCRRRCMNEGPSVANAKDGKCENEFETIYAPNRPEKVYCESCYQKTVL